jgi:crotonobetainyl-CoA:carnitine CoA-transferase CaiB-like acyl-CoA transferase
MRFHGHAKDGVSLWWKMISRNKLAVALNLSTSGGADVFLRLVETADVVIENFRPGRLEAWGLGYDVLKGRNPGIILARVTGFGQTGPYAGRPGFGTLAEAMSGFAEITGEAGGPPTLPPFGLADSIAGVSAAAAISMALYHREVSGQGQVIDLNILEPIVTALGPQPIWYDQLGIVQRRTGNRSINNAPRNIYQTKDNKWVAVSASATAVAERVLGLVGHPEIAELPWFRNGRDRAKHADVIDMYVSDWIGERNQIEVIEQFEAADAAVAPIYDVADLMADPHVVATDMITTVDDPDLGLVRMQNVLFRMSKTPGSIRWSGRSLGADTDRVLTEAGITEEQLNNLREAGDIG